MDCRKTFAFLYFPLLVIYEELVLRVSTGVRLISTDSLYVLLFSLCAGAVLYLLSHIGRVMPYILTWVITVFYMTQQVYYRVFGAYLVLGSVKGADQAANSLDVVFTTMGRYAAELMFMLLPAVLFCVFAKKVLSFKGGDRVFLLMTLAFAVLCHISAYAAVHTDEDAAYYYDEVYISQTAVWKYGLICSQRLDLHHTLFGFKDSGTEVYLPLPSEEENESGEPDEIKIVPHKTVNLNYYIRNEEDEQLLEMHQYFASVPPTYTNEMTGRFKGKNLVLITAEAFSHYCVDPVLTPTLYKLKTQGFDFTNFYTPGWGVSTTDGEYQHLTGLIPKSGVWSFKESAANSMPFTIGMQSHKAGYRTIKGYHNHTYTYYRRNLYLENIGYDYKGIGNGLVLEHEQWPNSDLEMMKATIDEYIDSVPFSVYYMTVSGHGGYGGNNLSRKNFDYVRDLPYSFEVKNYLAANIELDRAIEYLIRRLDEKGILEDTVISISADHYPYILDECNGLDELAGHPVDQKYERYKNAWLLWCGDMDEGVKVDTYCGSMDILPTLSNLFGFDYDSRLLMGTDVFSSTQPLVIFQDQSWISQNGSFDARTGEYILREGATGEDDISALKKSVRAKFKMSRQILELDYYRKVVN